MTILDFISLLVIGGVAWFWFDSAGAREAGIKAARNACDSENLQFLDETVSFANLKLQRNEDGRMLLRRTYKFEFSDTGNNRRIGSIILLGRRVVAVNIGLRLVTDNTTFH